MVDGGIDAQTVQSLQNIDAILRAVHLDRAAIAKLTVFVKDLKNSNYVSTKNIMPLSNSDVLMSCYLYKLQ